MLKNVEIESTKCGWIVRICKRTYSDIACTAIPPTCKLTKQLAEQFLAIIHHNNRILDDKKSLLISLNYKYFFLFQQIYTDHPKSSSTPPLNNFFSPHAAHFPIFGSPHPHPNLVSVCGKAQGDCAQLFMATFQPIYLPHNSSTALWVCVHVCVCMQLVPCLLLRRALHYTAFI